jgi:DNA-binding LytR/AlgR family response regulator
MLPMTDKEYSTYFTFKAPDGFAQIQLQKISHFLFEDSKPIIVIKRDNARIITESMKSIEAILRGHKFVRIHQNYILNLRQELNICMKPRKISLSNNKQVTIAKDRIV